MPEHNEKDNIVSKKKKKQQWWSKNDGAIANMSWTYNNSSSRVIRCFLSRQCETEMEYCNVCVCALNESVDFRMAILCVLCQYYSDVMTLMRSMWEWRVFILKNFIRLNASAMASVSHVFTVPFVVWQHLNTQAYMYIHQGFLSSHHLITWEINYGWQCVISCHIYSVYPFHEIDEQIGCRRILPYWFIVLIYSILFWFWIFFAYTCRKTWQFQI